MELVDLDHFSKFRLIENPLPIAQYDFPVFSVPTLADFQITTQCFENCPIATPRQQQRELM